MFSETMLRMYLLQQWYGLADEALEDAIYDSQALREGFRGRRGLLGSEHESSRFRAAQ